MGKPFQRFHYQVSSGRGKSPAHSKAGFKKENFFWGNLSLHFPANMMNTVRAFIAIEMHPLVMDIIRRSQQMLRSGDIHLRWVRPENIHLTLRFLGDISTDAIDGIRYALEQAAANTPSFFLRVKGAGVFPSPARPRVVWLGLDGQLHLLEELYGRLSTLLSEQGISLENRPFRGHLTIGRARGRLDAERLKSRLAELRAIESRPFQADRLCLFKSDLTPRGAIYTPLVQVRTGGGTFSQSTV